MRVQEDQQQKPFVLHQVSYGGDLDNKKSIYIKFILVYKRVCCANDRILKSSSSRCSASTVHNSRKFIPIDHWVLRFTRQFLNQTRNHHIVPIGIGQHRRNGTKKKFARINCIFCFECICRPMPLMHVRFIHIYVWVRSSFNRTIFVNALLLT